MQDAFDEYEKTDEELKIIMKKIRHLCDQHKYDEAEQVKNDEYIPLQEKWRTNLGRFLKSAIKRI